MSFTDFGSYDSGDYAGGGGGGGYDTGGGFTKNQGGTPDKKGAYREQSVQTVTPLTCTLLMNSPLNNTDDSVSVDGRQVSKVVVCGRVVGVEPKTSYTEYSVDDGTAIIKVVSMNDEENPEAEKVPLHAYLKAYGVIRVLENERKVNALVLRTVTDQNEFTHHMLSVLHNHYLLTRGPLAGNQSAPSNFNGGFVNPTKGATAVIPGIVQPSFAAGVDADSKRVHDAIARDEITDTGPSLQEVARMTGFSIDRVRTICQTLTSEGYIYSTIDDDHYKSTGSMI